jgi:signal transduction histidine kinase
MRAAVLGGSADAATEPSRVLDRALSSAMFGWRAAPQRLITADDDRAMQRLADQLRRVGAGGPALVNSPLDSPSAVAFVKEVRKCLLEDARSGRAEIEVDELSSMLLALDAVVDQLGANMEQLASGEALPTPGAELVVEVAHDMRSPLTSILFLVETLRSGHSGPVNAVQERQLALVYSAAFGLSAIASDVIELARGSGRVIEATPIAFSVHELIQSVCDILLPMVEEKGLSIRVAPPAVDHRIGYPASLGRVLLNLATNAVKFTSHGYVEISASHLSASRIEFSVRDTGPGVPPSVMGQLFEPFRGHHAGTHSFSSAGLGLAICSRLVAGMDGELRVETSPETGTRFSFELDLPTAPRL